MLEITYWESFALITIVWILLRVILAAKRKKVSLGNEARQLLVFVCIVVIVRIVYFPWHLINGQIGTLKFDSSRITPFWLNLVPFVHMFERYDGWQLNLFGNIAMFVPVGIVWPVCFERINTFAKTVAAGAGFTLCIEISQLLFYERSSDIDDIILNTAGAAVGALIYFTVKRIKSRQQTVEKAVI